MRMRVPIYKEALRTESARTESRREQWGPESKEMNRKPLWVS